MFAGTAAEFFSNETRLIDGSGLSGTPTIDNYVSITHGAADGNNAWVTTDPNGSGDFYAVGGTVVFNFALDQQYGLTDLVFWGYHFGGPNGNEGRQFRLEMSTDGGTNFGAPITVEQPLETFAVQNSATLSLAGTYNANFVRMTVLDNHYNPPAAPLVATAWAWAKCGSWPCRRHPRCCSAAWACSACCVAAGSDRSGRRRGSRHADPRPWASALWFGGNVRKSP